MHDWQGASPAMHRLAIKQYRHRGACWLHASTDPKPEQGVGQLKEAAVPYGWQAFVAGQKLQFAWK
jgi:hypothetical protein